MGLPRAVSEIFPEDAENEEREQFEQIGHDYRPEGHYARDIPSLDRLASDEGHHDIKEREEKTPGDRDKGRHRCENAVWFVSGEPPYDSAEEQVGNEDPVGGVKVIKDKLGALSEEQRKEKQAETP